MKKLFDELKERNIFKEGIAYLVVAWLILQVAVIVFPLLEFPEWALKALLLVLILGFPVWLLIAWLYEITPGGFIRNKDANAGKVFVAKRGNRLNRIIIIALAIAVALLLYDKFGPQPTDAKFTEIAGSKVELKSIAVLPFQNMSQDKESQVFCDGVMEDILTNLAHLKDLKVISRTSAMHYKDSNQKIPDIAKELEVAFILEGSVRKYENKVRLVAQLINARDDSHVWANSFDRELEIDQIFDIQSEIALQIAHALKVNISEKEKQQLEQEHTQFPKAYELMLEGRFLADDRTVDGLRESVNKLESAIELDPNYADAMAELANSTWLLGYYSDDVNTENAYQEAEDLAKDALGINPDISRAYSVLANVYFRTDRLKEATNAFEKALDIQPNDATTHHQYSIFYDNQGVTDKAFFHSNKALNNDPLSLIVNYHYLNLLLSSGKIDQAKKHLEKVRVLFDNAEEKFAGYYGKLHLAEGKYDEAIPYFESEMSLSRTYVAGELGYCYAKTGNKAGAKRALRKVHANAYNLNAAIIHFALEEKDSAYYYLDRCVTNGKDLGTIMNDPVFDPYRNETKFVEILNKIE